MPTVMIVYASLSRPDGYYSSTRHTSVGSRFSNVHERDPSRVSSMFIDDFEEEQSSGTITQNTH